MVDRKVVGLDDVLTALRIRREGGSWVAVELATGFNGATLRPKINRYLARTELGRVPTAEDRDDSPYAVVVAVELSTESIDSARERGMAWYSIAEALGVSEAKAKGLASPESRGRVYVGRKPAEPTPEPTPEEVAAAAKAEKAAKAKARREAKKKLAAEAA